MTHDWSVMSHSNPQSGAVSCERLMSLLAGWADAAHGTLAQRLAHALRRAVQCGALVDGTRLPPERAVAAALAVSRSTVSAALDELRAEGVVASRQGSGTRVRSRHGRATGTRLAEHFLPVSGIDLATGNPPDASHLPTVTLDVAALLSGGSGPGIEPLGLPALREALADRHHAHGQFTDTSQIHVTAGAHHAISLAVGALTAHGTPVAVEDPGYPGIFDIVDTLGARPVAVPSDTLGLVPAALDRVLTEHHPTVVYTQTGPHNPCGHVPPPGRRRALADVCDRHDVTVIEDTTLADLAYAGRPHPELATLCRHTPVVSIGSFSKTAWGGLRIGWMRAPTPLIEQTLYLRLGSDLGPSVPAQLLAQQLLPQLDDLAERRQATLAHTTAHAIDRLHTDLPDWAVDEPAGGSVLWAKLPVADAASFVPLAARHGVHVTPGSIATPTRNADPHLRICCDRPWPMVQEGIQRLQHAWREFTAAPRAPLG